MVQADASFNEKEFLFNLSRSEYEKEWGNEYRKPGILAQIVAFFVRWIPKVGPFKAFAFEIPTSQTEEMYMLSVNRTVDAYRSLLRDLDPERVELPNADFDTGREPQAGEYKLGDKTYAQLLHRHAKRHFNGTPSELRADILEFYHKAPAGKPQGKLEEKTRKELAALKAMPTGNH